MRWRAIRSLDNLPFLLLLIVWGLVQGRMRWRAIRSLDNLPFLLLLIVWGLVLAANVIWSNGKLRFFRKQRLKFSPPPLQMPNPSPLPQHAVLDGAGRPLKLVPKFGYQARQVDCTIPPFSVSHDPAEGSERVVLISALFGNGTAKPLLRFFLKSAARSGLDVILFGDQEPQKPLPSRVQHIFMSLSNLSQRVKDILPECFQHSEPVSFAGSKINDLKPLFGAILGPELTRRGFSMWGHVDNDMLIGRLVPLREMTSSNHEPEPHSREGDPAVEVVPGIRGVYASGPLTLYRHSCRASYLFRRARNVCDVFRDEVHWAFDEWGQNVNDSSGSNMHAVNHAAHDDRKFQLRVARKDARFAFWWDGRRHASTCEMRCPAGGGACMLVDACPPPPTVDGPCEPAEVAFCHLQSSKHSVNSLLEQASEAHVQALLDSELLWVRPEGGIFVPTAEEIVQRYAAPALSSLAAPPAPDSPS